MQCKDICCTVLLSCCHSTVAVALLTLWLLMVELISIASLMKMVLHCKKRCYYAGNMQLVFVCIYTDIGRFLNGTNTTALSSNALPAVLNNVIAFIPETATSLSVALPILFEFKLSFYFRLRDSFIILPMRDIGKFFCWLRMSISLQKFI